MSSKNGCGILVIIFIFVFENILGHPLSDIYETCERYTQCRTIATLDERLCLGNTRSMPFWLPPNSLKADEMAEHCHKSLKPYYKQLERLENEQSQQLLACLMEQAVPMNSDQRLQCHRDLRRAPKYDFTGDLMDRIPTNCFQGIERRLEKQCGILKNCCSSIENCANFENSEITMKIKKVKDFIKDYGKQCQLGLATEDLLLNLDDEDNKEERKRPNGNIIVRFNTEEKPKQHSPKIETSEDQQQRLLVRVFTAAEEIERLRESGDDVEADKLQKELENIEGMFKKTTVVSELEGTASVPTTSATSETEKEDGDEFWSTRAPKMITGLEIASEASTTTSTTIQPTTTTDTTEPTTIPSTTASTTPSTTTTTTSPTTTTTVTETTPSTTSTTTPSTSTSTIPSSTTTRIHLITDTPQPEPSEEESEALLPNHSPSTTVNDAPKSVSTNQPFPVDDILKKYKHVTTLNKLVEHFKDQNSESFTKNEHHPTTPSFIDSDKLHKFYDRWENSIREKLASNGNDENDPEAAQEYARLLKTLNTLRNVIYNN